MDEKNNLQRLLITLAIATVTSILMISLTTPLQIVDYYPKRLNRMQISAKSLQKLREEAWPYIPADLSDEDFIILLTKLKEASKVKKYIFRNIIKNKTSVGPKKWCGICEITYNRKMILHPETKAVVVHYGKFNDTTLQQLNSHRRVDQLYVWQTLESPESLRTMRGKTLEVETNSKFNLTQTYRRDSGIYTPYGDISGILRNKLKQGLGKNISLVLQGKTKIAVAVVSNCWGTSGAPTRLQIINEMKRLGLNMDTLGRCFGESVEERRSEFVKKLSKYKFYLSFENAFHCRDYITEKLMINGYAAGAVPVVLGPTKAEYEAVAPKESFIFVEDFATVASLVNYLKYLDEHDKEYLKYFRWIEASRSLLPPPKGATGLCRLCRFMHGINIDDLTHPNYNKSAPERPMFTDDIAQRTVKDLKKWFYDTENDDCFNKNIPAIKRLLP